MSSASAASTYAHDRTHHRLTTRGIDLDMPQCMHMELAEGYASADAYAGADGPAADLCSLRSDRWGWRCIFGEGCEPYAPAVAVCKGEKTQVPPTK